MAITTVEVESIHGSADGKRMIWFKAQDSEGMWYSYGPVITSDSAFDIEAHKAIVAANVADALAEGEVEAIVGGAE